MSCVSIEVNGRTKTWILVYLVAKARIRFQNKFHVRRLDPTEDKKGLSTVGA